MPKRTPSAIAAAARQHLDQSNTAFVPANLVKLAEMSVEFMESTAATLAAAGLELTEDELNAQPPA